MNGKEAINAVLDGKKVHADCDTHDFYYYMDGQKLKDSTGDVAPIGVFAERYVWDIWEEKPEILVNSLLGKKLIRKIGNTQTIVQSVLGNGIIKTGVANLSERELYDLYYVEGMDF